MHMYLLVSGNAGSQSMYTFSDSSFPLGSFPKWVIHLERVPVELWPEGQKGMHGDFCTIIGPLLCRICVLS